VLLVLAHFLDNENLFALGILLIWTCNFFIILPSLYVAGFNVDKVSRIENVILVEGVTVVFSVEFYNVIKRIVFIYLSLVLRWT
jgi:hypothetical protein